MADWEAGLEAGEQVVLFDVPDPEPLPRVLMASPAAGAPLYFRHRVKSRSLCDDCVQVTHDAWPGPSPMIRQATWKRIAGGSTRLLCMEHAAHWKEADGAD